MHPLVGDLSSLKIPQLESAIQSLTKKYFSTSNHDVRNQIVMMLDVYKEEFNARCQAEQQRILEEHKKDLDKLIRID